MTSKKQIEANRRNAKKSTGPKTEKGQHTSSRNALKHGLLARDVTVSGESTIEFERLLSGLKSSLRPANAMETALVEEIASCLWRLRRCRRFEAGLLSSGQLKLEETRYKGGDLLAKELYPDSSKEERRQLAELERQQFDPRPLLGRTFEKTADNLAKLSRYETMMRRALEQLIDRLQALQAARKASSDDVIDVETDVSG